MVINIKPVLKKTGRGWIQIAATDCTRASYFLNVPRCPPQKKHLSPTNNLIGPTPPACAS